MVGVDHMVRSVNGGGVGAGAAREDSQEKLVEETLYLVLEKCYQTSFYMTYHPLRQVSRWEELHKQVEYPHLKSSLLTCLRFALFL